MRRSAVDDAPFTVIDTHTLTGERNRYEVFYEGQGAGGIEGAIETTAEDVDRSMALVHADLQMLISTSTYDSSLTAVCRLVIDQQ